MNYIEAVDLDLKVKNMGCQGSLATSLVPHSTVRPEPDVESTVVCRLKAQAGLEAIDCAAINGSECPAGFSIEKLKTLNRSIK